MSMTKFPRKKLRQKGKMSKDKCIKRKKGEEKREMVRLRKTQQEHKK
jgi:hypothetical protein